MKKDLMRSLGLSHRRVAIALATVVAVGSVALSAQAADSPIHRAIPPGAGTLHSQRLNAADSTVEVFVQLDEPSVAELNINSLQQTGSMASADAQKAQATRVTAQQAAIRETLQAHGAQILSAHRVGANGLRISVAASQVSALHALSGVRSIGRVVTYKLDNIESVPWIGATNVWNTLGIKGKGVKIGIIDTGIDYTHANFGGSGIVADYTANNPNVIEPGSFPTAKVVGGYDFAGATYDAAVAGSTPTPDPDPLDVEGHGSHVSGTAAGIGVPGSIGPGVAPEASLYALKVFGDGGGSTNLVSEAIEWAMDPNGDGDMSDHLDVINMSLGSDFSDPNDPSAISANNAAALGIIVVAAAGNAGAVPYVTGAPALASAAISVAASTPGGRVYAKVIATAPTAVAGAYTTVEGAGPVQLKSVGTIAGSLVTAAPANGCAALTNASAIHGNVALVIRGSCGFLVKYQQAQAAGAKAIVVYNSGPTGAGEDPIVMGGLDNSVTIPGVMIPYSSGNTLSTTAGVMVRLEVDPDPTQDDRIADFSSQGPGSPDSSFKPDLSAPGVSIVSTAVGTGTGSANFQGTSMATPHVSGAAALLHQLHPDLNPAAIKALLQNSTVNANVSGDTKLTRQGVGVIRVDHAAALTSYASPGGVSFGRLNPVFPIVRSEEIKLTSLTQKSRVFTSKNVPNHSLPGVKVECPSYVFTQGKHAAEARITLKFDPRVTADAGIVDNGSISQTEVDGWCVFSDGKDQLRVGYIAVVDAASSVFATNSGSKKVTVRNFGPSVGWAEAFTLAKLGGEDLNRVSNAIAAVGFRRAAPNVYVFDGASLNVLELGVATERPFTHISKLTFDMLIDTDGDGVDDVEVLATDWSNLDSTVAPGTYVTAQFSAAGGFVDWEVLGWDFNDNTAILPFTLQSDGGFLPEKFSYTLNVIDNSDGSVDTQHGTIDMSKEIIPDLNSFGVGPRDKIDVKMKGRGTSLWLFQNNPAREQIGLSQSR